MLDQLIRIHDLVRGLGNAREGNSAVEFALAAPILITLAFGAFDYGRAYVEEVRMNGAAHAGAQYALYEPDNWSDSDTMERTALEEYVGYPLTDDQMAALPVSAAASNFCACTSGATLACSDTCSGGDSPGRFVRVTLNGAVPLTLPYPWSPDGQAAVDGNAVVRVR